MANRQGIILELLKYKLFLFALIFLLLGSTPSALASNTDGTIDTTNKWAWSENAGWLDFAAGEGNVHVTDSELTGYVYGENIGWISLNCANTDSCADNNYKVANDAEGTLSGYAWGENIGWIHFAPTEGGVTINTDGVFSGTAYSENIGWIVFATDHPVTTDWRPASSRVIPNTSSGSSATRVKPKVPEKGIAMNTASTASSTLMLPSNSDIGVKSPFIFWRNLSLHMSGTDVQELQKYLNTHGFLLAQAGVGAPGLETDYFGLLTYNALIKFQDAHTQAILAPVGLTKGTGYFGPSTRAFINRY